MNDKKVMLITGASGFLGTWLALEAVKLDFEIVGIDIHAPQNPTIWKAFATSTLETVDLDNLLGGYNLWVVCHLAGSASVPASISNPYGDFSSLVPGTSRLALFVARNQLQARFILFSSAAVYGNPVKLPITELTQTIPISPYGAHKLIAEYLLQNYSNIYGLKLTILRIFSVYGPGLRKQLIWDVCQRILNSISNGQNKVTLWGTGQETRDFIYVLDLCHAVLKIAGNIENEQVVIYNIASGVESKVITVVDEILSHMSSNVEIKFNGINSIGDPKNWSVDISLLEHSGFKPIYSLESGIKHSVQWIKSKS